MLRDGRNKPTPRWKRDRSASFILVPIKLSSKSRNIGGVTRVYNSLPPEQRSRTAIFENNYGEAGAIDFFGARYGLPKAISAHQNYYLWGPRDYKGEDIILLQWNRARAERYCNSVEEAGTNEHPLAMEDEHYRIFICHELKRPLSEVWPELKHWN